MVRTTAMVINTIRSERRLTPHHDEHSDIQQLPKDIQPSTFDLEHLARNEALRNRIRHFESHACRTYVYRFHKCEDQSLLKPEHYDKLLAKPVWRHSGQVTPATLSFSQLHEARAAASCLDAMLEFAGSEGICEGCTASNIRCKALPRRMGHCLLHVRQANRCKAIDEVFKHRCEETHGTKTHFCTKHEIRIRMILQHGMEAIEDQITKVAKAQALLDRIARRGLILQGGAN